MRKYRITVCTPTYNRAYILQNLYESLKNQRFLDFEWLVIDDGSIDDTQALFDKWTKEEHSFTIQYHKKENGGKHTAINKGLDLAKGEIFFVVDSDDWLTSDALEKIDNWFTQINGVESVKGIVANKGTSANNTTNAFFLAEYIDETFLAMDMYIENGRKVLSGERAIAFYTDFHRRYYYPEFVEEKFVTEAVVYNRMAHDGYKMRFFNDIIWVYEYKEDGLTRAGSRLFLENPMGYGLWLREKSEFLGESLLQRLKMYYTFTCDLSDRISSRKIAQCIGAPYLLIALFNHLHKLKHSIRKGSI